MVSEHSVLMGPPTAAQRLDVVEGKFTGLEETMKNMVEKTVEKAMEAMRHSLTEVLMEGQSMATKQFGAEFEAMTGRLEGRINRSREYHESLINTMRSEQIKFQTEVRSTITGIQSRQYPAPEGIEGSVNNNGTTSIVQVLS